MDVELLLKMPLVYSVPGMSAVRVRENLPYTSADGVTLLADVYSPPDAAEGETRPAVIFIHGDGPAELLRQAKDWGCYRDWGRLAATAGLVGVTFNHRSTQRLTRLPEVGGDIEALLAYIRAHAEDLGVDTSRLCIWTASAGGPFGLRAALREPNPAVRCAVAYYAVMDVRQLHDQIPPEVTDETLREFSPLYHLERREDELPPLLIARAGQDTPTLNEALDRFVREALAKNVEVDVLNHPSGRHAFDTLDDDARSRDIIARTLEFMRAHLLRG